MAKKETTARWWGSINNQNIFDGHVMINTDWTWIKRQCVTWFNTCNCIGPFVIFGRSFVIGDQHIAKPSPTVAVNHDDVPGSTQSVHHELGTSSAYPFYNNWFASNSHSTFDGSLHNFDPTVSGLDLHDPNNGFAPLDFFDPDALGILKTEPGVNHPQKRWGFPHLQFPNSHYQVTPFDGVFVTGNNNGTFSDQTPVPDNQYHVEDPRAFIGDYVARVEVAPTELFISDLVIGWTASTNSNFTGFYSAEFEARTRITVGKNDMNGVNIYDLHNNTNFLTENNDVTIPSDVRTILHCGEEIELMPGFTSVNGSELHAFILPFACNDNLFRTGRPTANEQVFYPVTTKQIESPLSKETKDSSILVFPNPSSGLVNIRFGELSTSRNIAIFDIKGQILLETHESSSNNVELDLNELPNGLYLLNVNETRFKLIIAR